MIKMRNLIVLLILGFTAHYTLAQKPIVNGFDKSSATVGETIVISGANFPTTATNLQVNFGSGKATIVSTSATEIRATVPATSTYGPVVVTNLSNGLRGTSSQFFTMSFGGSTFDLTALDTRIDINTGQQESYDICNCDFNDDGLLDVAIANNNSTNVSVYQNVSTINTTSFVQVTGINNIDNNLKPINTVATECSDLNGDGLPDLVFTSVENVNKQIFIYQNTSSGGTISFSPLPTFTLPVTETGTRTPRTFKIADMDLDGKPELIISDTKDGENEIFIYQNTSTGAISFNRTSPISLTVTGASKTGAIDVADLDGDQLPDIVTAPYVVSSSRIYAIKNQSTVGNINFAEPVALSPVSSWRNVLAADVNNDNLPDIIATNSNSVVIALNRGSLGNFNFPSSAVITTSIASPFGLAAGDLDGNGLADIAVTSTTNSLNILENLGGDTPSFELKSISTDFNTRNVEIADYNNDAKPDLGFTHRSEFSAFGFLSIITNRNCISPTISPTDITFCTGSPFTLEATNSINATYNWSFTGDVTLQNQSGNEATFIVNSGNSATITVGIATNDGSCSTSKSEAYTLTGGTPPSAPAITNSNTGIICGGSDFTLSGPDSSEEYLWTYPDGTTATSQEITISNASVNNAGAYTLRVKSAGGCFSNAATTNISVDQPPVISIINTGSDVICETSTTTLQVPDYAGYSYQWKQGTTNIGTDLNSISVSETGDYTVDIISETTGCSYTASATSITSYVLPTASFSSVDESCTNFSVSFDASASTGQTGVELEYNWEFGDGGSETGNSTSHTYSTAGTYTVSLTVGYSDLTTCTSVTTKDIIISDPPSAADIIADISPNPASTQKCPEDGLTLTLPNSYQTVNWTFNTEDITANSADVTTLDNQDEVTVTIDVITDIGCTVSGTTVTVSNFDNSGFVFSSPEGTVVNDTLELADNTSSILVNVDNGSDFTWSPEDLLSSTTGSSVTVFPRNRFSTIVVSGTDEAGCSITSDLTIIAPGVIARKSFSPNGDNIYDCWEILNSSDIQGCTIYIYDEKGSIVFKGDSPFTENCVWNGNLDNGSVAAPAGIYYFVFKCDDSSYNTSGTIVLAR